MLCLSWPRSHAGLYQSNCLAIAERQAAIARFEAVARYGSISDAQRQQPPEAAYSAWFLAESDPAIAAAGLQARLKELAQIHGIDVTQAHDVKPRVVDGTSYVGIGLEMSGGAEAAAALLRAVETEAPLLIVERAEIRAENSGSDPRYDPVVLYLNIEMWAALATPPVLSPESERAS